MTTQAGVLKGPVAELSSYEVDLLWRFMRTIAELVGDARKFAERQRDGEAWTSNCTYVYEAGGHRFHAEAGLALGISADRSHWVVRITVTVTRNGVSAMGYSESVGFLECLRREICCEVGDDGDSWANERFWLCATLLPRNTTH